jgi:hypothetical protein
MTHVGVMPGMSTSTHCASQKRLNRRRNCSNKLQGAGISTYIYTFCTDESWPQMKTRSVHKCSSTNEENAVETIGMLAAIGMFA